MARDIETMNENDGSKAVTLQQYLRFEGLSSTDGHDAIQYATDEFNKHAHKGGHGFVSPFTEISA